MFKFEFKNKGGNNFYIDDINVYNDNVGFEENINDYTNLNIYPNPVNDNAVISFALISRKDVKINLYDVLGRNIETISQGTLEEGDHQINFSKKMLHSGIYFLHLNINNNTIVKPVVIY